MISENPHEREITSAQHGQLCEAEPVQSCSTDYLIEERMQPTPRQLWFMTQRTNWNGFLYWNMVAFIEVLQKLEPVIMIRVVTELLKHHDALRLRIKQDMSGYYHLFAHLDDNIPFSYIDLSAIPSEKQQPTMEAAAREYQLHLNLIDGPVIFLVLFDRGPEVSQRLLIIVSHTVCDAFSLQVILNDLTTLYLQISHGQQPRLPPKTTSLKTLVEKKWEYSRSQEFQRELDYWQSLPWKHVCSLPLDFPEKKHLNIRASIKVVTASLSVEETVLLVQKLPKALHANLLDILLTAFIKMLTQWTGSNVHAFFLVNNGRITPFSEGDLSRTVGNLIAVPQIILDIEGVRNVQEALKKTQEQLRHIPGSGIMWEWLPLHMTLKSELAFNYLGQQGSSNRGASLYFRPAPESAGPTEDPQEELWTLLTCTTLILDRRLRIDLSYSENLFMQATIERLIGNYMTVLRSLIYPSRRL